MFGIISAVVLDMIYLGMLELMISIVRMFIEWILVNGRVWLKVNIIGLINTIADRHRGQTRLHQYQY